MPLQSVGFDVSVLASAGQMAASEKRDGLRRTCSLLHAQEVINGKGKPQWKGGQYFSTEITVQDHTGITQYADGFENYDASAYETQVVPLYPMCISGLMMKLGETQVRLLNATDGALRHKVETLSAATLGFLQRQWQFRIVTGGTTGPGFSNWTTLNGIDSTAGVFEQDAFGSQTNTIGGVSKTTYANVLGWQNCVANLNNAFGTNQIGLFDLIEQTKVHKPLDPKKKVWLITVQGMVNLKRVIQGNQLFTSNDPKDLDFGTGIEMYGGIKIFTENFLPISGTNTTTYPITAMLLDLEDIFFAWDKGKAAMGVNQIDGYFGTGQWGYIGGLQSVLGCAARVVGNTIVTDMGSSGIAYAGQTF